MPFHPSKAKKHRAKRADPYLMLTPMVDIFIVLLLFLLQSYSSLEEIVVSDEDFQLPISTSKASPHSALTIKVNNEVVVLAVAHGNREPNYWIGRAVRHGNS